MENLDGKSADSSQSVRVAVNIRPLITPELMVGCTDCITVVPGEPQVQIGSHVFTYDNVYGSAGSPCYALYDDCVAPLVDALFQGYNATVLAYGQTGSGKTYTMGTNYSGEGSKDGVIPKVMENIFKKVKKMEDSTEFLIRVSFIEIFKEEVFDLLDANACPNTKAEGTKPYAPPRVPIQIRETVNGGITLVGVTEAEVRTTEEMTSHLSCGSLARATGSTNMNSQSSRSHAIFTITMEQKKKPKQGMSHDDSCDDILCAKLHLVDLAGSERAKRTGADGMRFKEGVHINKGLLALGNVISALGDEKKRREGCHVPYRDSKLTRLLQDSLGGNSRTVMIACVSPADSNAEETLNTLKYANRARNIQNKAVINRDPVGAQIQKMRSQIEQLQAELLFYRGDAGLPYEELQILKHKISLLEASNGELLRELQERRVTCDHLSQRAIDAQVEKDKLAMIIESVRNGKSLDEIESNFDKDCELVKSYVSKIQELEGEVLRLQSYNNPKLSRYADLVESDDDRPNSSNILFPCSNEYSSDYDPKAVDISDGIEDHEKELEHSTMQERLDRELKELDKKLEQKEAEMKRFSGADTSVLKQHYEKKVHELEQEKRALQKEIEVLKCNLSNISSTSDDGAQKLKQEYLQKLNFLETQVSELKKKQDAQAQILRQKQKSDEAAKRLLDEIHRIKSHKVQLQHKIKQESEQFRLWKASREKEVLQLKKEGRRNEYEMHKLLALNQRQKMVLQRKTEEAAQATKRLKELLESRKAARETSSGGANGPGIQALMQNIEHELEVTVRVHEVRSEYERQMEERSKMANELTRLKEEEELIRGANLSDCTRTMSPGARNSRIFALENMLATSSSSLVSMASHLSEAEERERVLGGGRGRWHQVRSLVDAKNIMNFLMNLASSSRCLLWDKEFASREKDSEIRELKQKIVNLSGMLKKSEAQKAELIHQQNSALKKHSMRSTSDQINSGGHNYNLRKQDQRSSIILLADMDTSDSDYSDRYSDDNDANYNWEKSMKRRHTRKQIIKAKGRSSMDVSDDTNNANNANFNSDSSGDGVVRVSEATTATTACCLCSKFSSCKTTKCLCRANGGACGLSCGCIPSKCSNRGSKSERDESMQPDLVGDVENATENGETNEDESRDLVSNGARLLQNALAERPSEAPPAEDGGAKRKPLSDIGNTLAKSKSNKPNQRKKWRKSTIQLIPTPQPSSQPEIPEPIQKTENDSNEVANVPLKLPRAMRSATAAANGSNLLRERNSDQPEDSVGGNKEHELIVPKRVDEKENCNNR
ncbi:kinesin-like protein KIN-4C isoform X1 [Cucurbita moschata]|uniref:Kinesin-like protein KIN-4C isoform X1 n=1 Tax=Cucurbita moschata TaxID=3662 RepID=A0A6J1FM79_CUCMO|nr:kinesin-like protein KIN-4C isoform X1 [Cucurbita moschata]XP_022941357.1 kinesin-like protein KIN-4C isoform X1 [Cucurbita moschata]